MVQRPPQRPPAGPLLGVLIVFGLACGTLVSAQELPLQRNYPGTGPFECPTGPAPVAPTDDERVRASQLISDALQASILGDLEGARTLLDQAAEADQTAAEVAYRHGRALEDLTLRDEAILEYCRAIALGARDVGILDSRARLDALYEVVRERVTDRARGAFVSGLREADAQTFDLAAASFTVAIEEVPEWAEAIYNRAVVFEQLGRVQESLTDYRRYLMLTPDDVDPVVVAVSERIGLLEGAIASPTPSPSTALLLGVVPGVGHYYSGRGVTGTIVMALAAGAVASGFLIQDITVRCLNTPAAGADCPPGDILDETTDRPYLVPALGAAGAVTLVAAIEAFVRARGRRAAQAEAVDGFAASGIAYSGPSVAMRGTRVDLNVVSLRFR